MAAMAIHHEFCPNTTRKVKEKTYQVGSKLEMKLCASIWLRKSWFGGEIWRRRGKKKKREAEFSGSFEKRNSNIYIMVDRF